MYIKVCCRCLCPALRAGEGPRRYTRAGPLLHAAFSFHAPIHACHALACPALEHLCCALPLHFLPLHALPLNVPAVPLQDALRGSIVSETAENQVAIWEQLLTKFHVLGIKNGFDLEDAEALQECGGMMQIDVDVVFRPKWKDGSPVTFGDMVIHPTHFKALAERVTRLSARLTPSLALPASCNLCIALQPSPCSLRIAL